MSIATLPAALDILGSQRRLYEGDFYRRGRWRWTFRDDCRYRWHRLREYLVHAGFSLQEQAVLEIGFGSGDLLFLFSTSCKLMGIELSGAAVEAIRRDPRLEHHTDHWFDQVREDGALPSPPERADILITSHVLEHAPDDHALLAQALPAVRPGGIVVTFVPLEVPGFDPKHVRVYTPDRLRRLMERLGLQVLHLEENYRICSGPFRWMDRPARHGWPALRWLEGIRNAMLTVIPYETTRAVEGLLQMWGVAGSQVMCVARVARDE